MSSAGKIKLQSFVRQQRASLERFEAWWLDERKSWPSDFPLMLLPGEWDEQFMCWIADNPTPTRAEGERG